MADPASAPLRVSRVAYRKVEGVLEFTRSALRWLPAAPAGGAVVVIPSESIKGQAVNVVNQAAPNAKVLLRVTQASSPDVNHSFQFGGNTASA
ncbi:hypothetical protein HK405_015471, partial [Cladochytrium tenue]